MNARTAGALVLVAAISTASQSAFGQLRGITVPRDSTEHGVHESGREAGGKGEGERAGPVDEGKEVKWEDEYFEHPIFGYPKPPSDDDTLWDKYTRFMNHQIQKVSNMDLYGVTSQLPKGFLSFKWDWGMVKANRRYDQNRHLGAGMPPIEFSDGSGKKLISLDLGLTGVGGGHTIQVSYGIIDELDWYIEIPFTYMDVKLNPVAQEVDDDGNRIDPALGSLFGITDPKSFTGEDFLVRALPKLGRPTPAVHYKGEWVLGDINTGFSWNYYRSHRMSAALTPRVYFPTGRIANPNNSLLYGTGPELDVSVGGWGVSATNGFDFRIYNLPPWLDLIASTELTTTYWFPHRRNYPTNFVKPDPVVAALDPTGEMFPDLTHLKGSFRYWPGLSMSWYAQLNIQVTIVGLGVAYGIQYSQEPEIDADPAFLRMVDGLELLGAQTAHIVQLGASINLLPFYIPMEIAFQWKKMVDGYNAIVFDDFYQITFKTYIPINPDD